ncbi:recombinase family protein [Pseudomaricurvus alkylphenolicus]|uniref:recombinase family protein n=1 Tax=Pseudomaricurvus alkylphenolicus TaxID=1306991 RepID=UPI00141EB8AF|nr:recombinase family protein [Pseudomaricurvus alkylphenolicus]NIB45123.1 recombinase family protein [Pseudomaricurvus alkylphenolicus]
MNQHQPARYVAYYRVSTQKQGQSGLGLEAQQTAVREFLAAFGGEVLAEFIEVESGKRADRPEFTKAADYAELANATVLVAKLDRLSRDLHFITSLQKRGIRFKLCDLPEIDQLTIHILAAMAEHEARMISIRTKQALKAAKDRGVVLGNPHLEAQRNRDVSAANSHRVQKQRDWQEKIFKVITFLEASEELSTCQAIADALNDRGLRTIRGAEFSVPIVSRLRRQRDLQSDRDLQHA